ncbi:ATP synthase subunit b [Algimonas arctica]|uniref:ATP synthase subunit b n=1 Tax=Algimonas arctica TaxID=1479486 RepID=A0A8J3CPR2_9PROT|nr:F0F1 ATP synthase subunit B [Algimonas arctica]GHA82887.1 ATP synthase subunit b [Algimonas arctica]
MTANLIFAGGKAWYLASEFWVLVPVLLFLALVAWKGGFKAAGSALDKRADTIRRELDEARRLREEAQALLASYQRKQAEAETLAEEIVERARRDAEAMAAKARTDLTDRLHRRAAQAEAKIASAESQALAEVKSRAADLAVNIAEQIIRTEMSAADRTRLFKDGLSQMGGALN